MTQGDTVTVLFLCVQNSARSQMAEAIARVLAPPGVTVLSAGSAPTAVNPHALRALAEAGYDASTQRSKGLAEIPLEEVDVVVTLCADEVCPAFPGDVVRLHWPLPDPAARAGSAAEVEAAFRTVRDELERRVTALFTLPIFPRWEPSPDGA